MKAVQLLQVVNTISRHKHQLQQDLVFVMLIENVAYHKLVEVHWAGEDRAWHRLRADYHSATGANREIWRAQSTFHASDGASLPGDVEFALRYRVLGKEYWDNNGLSNYFSNADSGVLLEQSVRLLNADFNPFCRTGNATILSRPPSAIPCNPSTSTSTGRSWLTGRRSLFAIRSSSAFCSASTRIEMVISRSSALDARKAAEPLTK